MLYNSAYNLDQLSKYYGTIKNSDTLALLTNVNPMEVHGNDTYSCDDNGIFHFNLYTSALYFYLGNDIELNEGDYICYPADREHIFKALEPDTQAILVAEQNYVCNSLF